MFVIKSNKTGSIEVCDTVDQVIAFLWGKRKYQYSIFKCVAVHYTDYDDLSMLRELLERETEGVS